MSLQLKLGQTVTPYTYYHLPPVSNLEKVGMSKFTPNGTHGLHPPQREPNVMKLTSHWGDLPPVLEFWLTSTFGKTRIDLQLDKQKQESVLRHNKAAKKNREILKRLTAVTCFLGKQELPFHGHNEASESNNRGNYIELIKLLAEFDEKLDSHFTTASVFTELSPLIQNDLIQSICTVMTTKIKIQVGEAKFVGIMIDETSDVSNFSQLSVVLRYVHDGDVVERFVGFYNQTRCAYVVLVMSLFWITEALPLPVTSMIPIVAFPLMGILPTEEVCMVYFKETNMMFVGGLIVAIAIEHSNLHKRVALNIMLLIGSTHIRLLLGLMMCTMFVSMWVSNTAATAMMAPIAQAILEELEGVSLFKIGKTQAAEIVKKQEEYPNPSRTTRCYFLAITYSATIGGTGTLVGTGTNLTFKGLFESLFPKAPPISFGKWMMFNVPGMLLNNILIWLSLIWMYLGFCRKGGMDEDVARQKLEDKEEAKQAAAVVRGVVKSKLQEMGGLSWHEISVGLLFLLVVSLWVTRSPGIFPGWAEVITETKVKDATAAMFVSILFFILPARLDFLYSLSSDPEKRPTKTGPALLTWKVVNQKMPWGLIFLLGGGFALAAGSAASGMSKAIGQSLKGMSTLPPFAVLVLCTFIATNMTEFSSNVAIASILLPVLAEMAVAIEIHPMYLMIPVTLCCSFAFMMPVGTPGNAIVAGMVNIRTKQMIVAGIIPSIVTLIVVCALFPTWGDIVYGANGFPKWATDREV
ncbi:protein I'm not dead yet-like [Anabrus simplex]|uniref:protein I'm not dead yet-like n=1 Tax=Anabrus simplex TaxID=316456 RepID=UPI0035A2F0EC